MDIHVTMGTCFEDVESEDEAIEKFRQWVKEADKNVFDIEVEVP